PQGLLSLLASPSFNSALDTQLMLAQLDQSQQELLAKLASSVKDERATESRLRQEQSEEQRALLRVEAEEVVAEFEAAQVSAAPPSTDAGATNAATPTNPSPNPSPTPTPTPLPSPSTTPTPAPPPPPSAPFSVTTNLTLPSGITAKQISEFLALSPFPPDPLSNDVTDFLQAEQEFHVSAIFIVAHAVLETGWGTSQIYLQKHNLFGYGADDSNPFQDAMQFASDAACIQYVPEQVAQNYLSSSGEFYTAYGPTLQGMNVYYATSSTWASSIARLGDVLQTMPA
ncbi:MAG: glucosaminidase domain-containing protein, partial [Candidatus Dormibacteria bacterium]